MNKWSSTITIPQGDKYLNISSAAMGKLSTTPIGASNQPFTFPKGKSASVYQFDPKIFNENSWPMLKDVLTKVGCVSGCRLTVSHVAFRETCNSLGPYTLRCSMEHHNPPPLEEEATLLSQKDFSDKDKQLINILCDAMQMSLHPRSPK